MFRRPTDIPRPHVSPYIMIGVMAFDAGDAVMDIDYVGYAEDFRRTNGVDKTENHFGFGVDILPDRNSIGYRLAYKIVGGDVDADFITAGLVFDFLTRTPTIWQNKKKEPAMRIISSLLIAGLTVACVDPGASHKANVFKAGQVNQRQEVKTVNILAVQPAQVEVSNKRNREIAEGVGLLLGAVLGAAIGESNNRGSQGAVLGAASRSHKIGGRRANYLPGRRSRFTICASRQAV